MDEDYTQACCDQCGPYVRAKAVVALPSGRTLAYCGSHANYHRAAIQASGGLIVGLGDAQGH